MLAALVSLVVSHHARQYLLHVPPKLSSPAPLVLVFHGGTDTPENMERISGFSALADREGFIVAYPAALKENWADGRGASVAEERGIDDVAFTRAIVADIRKRYAIDAKRIYATGPSNGGIFSHKLGCEAADLFAAIGPVIGTLASNELPHCKPAATIPVVSIQGVADPLMPFAGGDEGGPHHLGRGGRIESARATQQFWAKSNGCSAESTAALPVAVDDGTRVTKRTFSSCRDGAEVVWYEIEGGGHRWPPRKDAHPFAERLAQRAFGVSSQNIDATRVLWDFFKAHPKAR
jgi:polyhydroxybutyrate depolymerase